MLICMGRQVYPKEPLLIAFLKKGRDVNCSSFATLLRALVDGEPSKSPLPWFLR